MAILTLNFKLQGYVRHSERHRPRQRFIRFERGQGSTLDHLAHRRQHRRRGTRPDSKTEKIFFQQKVRRSDRKTLQMRKRQLILTRILFLYLMYDIAFQGLKEGHFLSFDTSDQC